MTSAFAYLTSIDVFLLKKKRIENIKPGDTFETLFRERMQKINEFIHLSD